ncbi:MAG: hypothetical protein HY053_08260 [Proteobacteria bacterium]|nr:hypothetical protein [Pseudomonadota bacterium]
MPKSFPKPISFSRWADVVEDRIRTARADARENVFLSILLAAARAECQIPAGGAFPKNSILEVKERRIQRPLPALMAGVGEAAAQDLLFFLLNHLAEKNPPEAAAVTDQLLSYRLPKSFTVRLEELLGNVALKIGARKVAELGLRYVPDLSLADLHRQVHRPRRAPLARRRYESRGYRLQQVIAEHLDAA